MAKMVLIIIIFFHAPHAPWMVGAAAYAARARVAACLPRAPYTTRNTCLFGFCLPHRRAIFATHMASRVTYAVLARARITCGRALRRFIAYQRVLRCGARALRALTAARCLPPYLWRSAFQPPPAAPPSPAPYYITVLVVAGRCALARWFGAARRQAVLLPAFFPATYLLPAYHHTHRVLRAHRMPAAIAARAFSWQGDIAAWRAAVCHALGRAPNCARRCYYARAHIW